MAVQTKTVQTAGTTTRARARRFRQERWYSVLFITPAALFLLLTSVYPILYSVFLSFRAWNMSIPFSRPRFIGLGNYTELLQSPELYSSLRITLTFVVVSVSIEFVLGMLLALLATSPRVRAIGLIRTVLMFPLMMTPVVAGVLWRTLYHSSYGVVNYLLELVGLPHQTWLGTAGDALGAVIAVEIWQQLPVVIFVLAAGIQSLPSSLPEAAAVDGASKAQVFRYITLPLLRPVILVVLVLRIMDAFRIFDVIYTMTQGGPAQSTEVLSLLIYKTGLRFFDMGMASAQSVVFLVLTLCISFYFIHRLLRE